MLEKQLKKKIRGILEPFVTRLDDPPILPARDKLLSLCKKYALDRESKMYDNWVKTLAKKQKEFALSCLPKGCRIYDSDDGFNDAVKQAKEKING